VTARESVLVVDDEPEVTSVLQELQEREGYAVHVAQRAPSTPPSTSRRATRRT
jgi:CheY-like chemotaxis protein